MKRYVRYVLFAAFSLVCVGVGAAPFGSAFGEVKELAAGGVGTGSPSKNLIYFTVDGTATFADCATSSGAHFVINTDDGGETMASVLIAAKLSKQKVHVAGRGTCANIPGHEDVSLIWID